jgi:hypothetical protein
MLLIHISVCRIIPYNQKRLTFSALILRMLLAFVCAVTAMPKFKFTAFAASSCCSLSSNHRPFLLRRLFSNCHTQTIVSAHSFGSSIYNHMRCLFSFLRFGTMPLDIYAFLVLTDLRFLLVMFLQELLRAKIWWGKSIFRSITINEFLHANTVD